VKKGILLCLLVAAFSIVSAEEAFSPEFAKLNTSDAGVLDPGNLEISLSYDYSKCTKFLDQDGDSHTRGDMTENGFSLGFTAGLFSNFDLALGIGYVNSHDDDASPDTGKGITDLEVTGRFRPTQGKTWAVAILPSAVFPTGADADEAGDNAGTSQGFTSLGLSAVLQKAFGRCPVNLEAGYSIGTGEEAEGYNGTLALNAAIGYHAATSFLPIVEANYSRDSFEGGFSSKNLALTFGLLFPTEKAGRFQVGINPLVWGRDTDCGTSFNLSWVYGFSIQGGK